MYTNNLKREVLKCYKQLLRTREKIFAGDEYALDVTKMKAREMFTQNKGLTDMVEIEKALKIGRDSNEILKTTVIQAKITPEGNYRIELENQHIY